MRTLSNLIDKKLKKDELTRKREKTKFQRKMQEVEKLITNQFEKAKYVIGDRLQMTKQHESMYYFHFDIGDGDFRSLYIHGRGDWDLLNVDSIFEINVMSRERYTNVELTIISETTYLKDLNKVLVNWCRVLTDGIIGE